MGQGRDLAVATLVAYDGRAEAAAAVGSRLVIDAGGNICGSLASGELDAMIRTEALAAIACGEPRLLDLDLPDGHARVYVERLG